MELKSESNTRDIELITMIATHIDVDEWEEVFDMLLELASVGYRKGCMDGMKLENTINGKWKKDE